MKATGSIFTETAIKSEAESTEHHTNNVCETVNNQNYQIVGKNVRLPVTVSDASMMMNAFLVDAKVAQFMITDSGFRVVELFPGKAILQLLCVDYRNNDLGDYNEGAIIFPVLAPGETKPPPLLGPILRMAKGTLGNYVYRMPVDQAFTTHAGRYIWGFPKWVARIDIEFGDKQATGTFYDEDQLVFGISARTGGNTVAKKQRLASLAIRDGKAWRTFGTTQGSGLTFSMRGAMPDIGDEHPLALELRALGLPKKPLFTVSMKNTSMTFDGPESVDIGQPFKSK